MASTPPADIEVIDIFDHSEEFLFELLVDQLDDMVGLRRLETSLPQLFSFITSSC